MAGGGEFLFFKEKLEGRVGWTRKLGLIIQFRVGFSGGRSVKFGRYERVVGVARENTCL